VRAPPTHVREGRGVDRPFLVQSQARAVGLELTVEPDCIELVLLRLRVVRGEVTFEELRRWFAAQLRRVQ
jgi:hypothetical protein